jgi:uncharacterized damage-inducible protein DinB
MASSALRELLYGEGSHVNTLGCIEDVPFEVAGRLAAGSPHSIWQIVWHMNFWMNYELQRIRNQNPPYPANASESWPEHPAPENAAEWEATVQRFRELLAGLASLANFSPEALAREIAPTHPGHTRLSSSLEAVLWQTLVHNSYHIGQVAILRRALGAWPPKSGGDTW